MEDPLCAQLVICTMASPSGRGRQQNGLLAASQIFTLPADTMQEPAYYDARTRDWDSEKDSPNALPNAQQHESTTTPSDQNRYDAVDGKDLDRTLTADSHVHHKVRRLSRGGS